jgi:hypothetical protein
MAEVGRSPDEDMHGMVIEKEESNCWKNEEAVATADIALK